MNANHMLPTGIAEGATLRGNEYGWIPSAFPSALVKAEAHGYACLGGQFQFRLPDGGTCEMYWLKADAAERRPKEPWSDYAHRSCSEVRQEFERLMTTSDFKSEASNWPRFRDEIEQKVSDVLVFVAYFVTESEYANLR
jgi:hypothetical protein